MKFVIKLMIFSILLNLSIGIMIDAVPIFGEVPAYRAKTDYNTKGLQEFQVTTNESINPTGDLEDSSSSFDRLLDKLNLGLIQKIKLLTEKYMFGFVQIISPFLGLSPNFVDFINLLTGMAYVLTLIWLWTGKDLGA